MPRSDQGVTRNRYTLIPRTLIFLVREDKVLLIKGSPDKRLWANRYNGVGGHIEQGEDVLSAARRELIEETGIEVKTLWICGVVTIDSGEDVGIGIYVLRGEWSSSDDLNSGDIKPTEEGTLEWVKFDELYNLPLVEDLPVLLPRILKSQKSGPPFSAHYSYDDFEHLVITFGT